MNASVTVFTLSFMSAAGMYCSAESPSETPAIGTRFILSQTRKFSDAHHTNHTSQITCIAVTRCWPDVCGKRPLLQAMGTIGAAVRQ
jgi:hypothetical protein